VEIDCLSNFGHNVKRPLLLKCVIRITRLPSSTCEFVIQFIVILEGYELGQCSSFVVAAPFQRLGFQEECATYTIFEAVGTSGSELVDVDRPRLPHKIRATADSCATQPLSQVRVSRCLCRRQFSLAQAFGNGLHNRREGRGCRIHLLFTAFMARYRSAHRHI
jgi:hypothetical protein